MALAAPPAGAARAKVAERTRIVRFSPMGNWPANRKRMMKPAAALCRAGLPRSSPIEWQHASAPRPPTGTGSGQIGTGIVLGTRTKGNRQVRASGLLGRLRVPCVFSIHHGPVCSTARRPQPARATVGPLGIEGSEGGQSRAATVPYEFILRNLTLLSVPVGLGAQARARGSDLKLL